MSIIDFVRGWICPDTIDTVLPVEHPFTTLCPISGSHIRGILSTAFPDAQIRIADRDYSAPSLAEFTTWLETDDGNIKKYRAEIFDCDDFSNSLRCAMFKVNLCYKTTMTLAYCEGHALQGYHAFNILINNLDAIYVVEPQTDSVLPYRESAYLPEFIQL